VERLRQDGVLRSTRNDSVRAFASRWRKLRLQRGASLAAVAHTVGISVGFLSALERGHVKASVGTLRRLAKFYKVNLFDLFNEGESTRRIVRPGERKLLEAARGVRMELLAWGNTIMEPHLFRIRPGAGSGESYAHEGEEFLFVLRGELRISREGEEYKLRAGDSFYFESSTQHSWFNSGRGDTLILWINTPPTF
jgi:mannose-6-phosphate isomerase-like protein (cupin superfamily)